MIFYDLLTGILSFSFLFWFRFGKAFVYFQQALFEIPKTLLNVWKK